MAKRSGSSPQGPCPPPRCNLTLGVIGGTILFGILAEDVLTPDAVAQCAGRLRALGLAPAAYDALLAPTASRRWLQGVAAWQWSRTAVLFLGLAAAGLAGAIAGERERIRVQVFGDAPA